MGIISNLLFGDNQNKVSYKDALRDKYYNEGIASNYDAIYGGLNDYLDKNYEGGARKYKADIMQQNSLRQNESTANYKANRNNIFGNGLIGGLLNPIAQTVGGVGDLAGLALSGGKYNAWDSSKNPLGVSRDVLSDLGAVGETALTFLAPGATKGASIGSKMAKAGLMGAGYGATGSLRDMGSENFDPGKFALSTAIGGGVGAGMAGLGGLWNKYTSSVDKDAISKAMSEYSKKNAPYQEALEKLKSEGITGDGDALNKAYHNWAKTNHPDAVGRSQAVALLPANAGQGSVEPAQLLSSEKVSQQALENISGKAKANNPYIKANSFKTPVASYMKDVNDEIARNATEKFKTIQDAMNIVKAGRPAGFDISAIPRKKAANLVEALSNLKNNLITTNPNGKLSRYGTKVSNLLKTRKGKIGVGLGGGLLLSQLMRGNNSNSGQLSDGETQELYNYIYGGGQ